ncbi:MAG: pyridoxamine 5'-phosphate oxidase family protein [Pseudomonadota bacterium]
MNLSSYFKETNGTGVMATSNKNGVINTAIYSRPHVQGIDEVAFIMRDRLSHKNLEEVKHANYLFLEDGPGYSGIRLFLTKLDESTDPELIASLSRRHQNSEENLSQGEKFLVRFKVDKVLSLIGGEELRVE